MGLIRGTNVRTKDLAKATGRVAHTRILSALALLLLSCGPADDSAPYHGDVVDLSDFASCPSVEFTGEEVVPRGVFIEGLYFLRASELEDTVFLGPQALWTRGGAAPIPLGTEDQERVPVGQWLVDRVDWTYGQLAAGGSFTPVGTLPLSGAFENFLVATDPVDGRIYTMPREGGAVARVDLASGSIAWNVAVPVAYLTLTLSQDGRQVFGVSLEPALYAIDTETGAATREELPQPRTFHQVLAIEGDWRLLYTEPEQGALIEWWNPFTGTSIPVAKPAYRICAVCSVTEGDAVWIHDELFVMSGGGLLRVDSSGRCRHLGSGGNLLRGSRTQGGKTTLQAYWYRIGIERL